MKLVFGFFIIGFALYLCVMLIPPYYKNYEFEDDLKTEALMGTNSNTVTEDGIREAVFKKAQQLDIPITREGIQVHRIGNAYTGSITIDAPYSVHVGLIGYPLDLNFNASTTNKGAFH